MPLSKDPQKAANQLANLQKGREAAAAKVAAKIKGLSVVGYDEPPAKAPASKQAAAVTIDDETAGNGGFWVMFIAGVILLLVIVLLARKGGRDE